jgi:transposase
MARPAETDANPGETRTLASPGAQPGQAAEAGPDASQTPAVAEADNGPLAMCTETVADVMVRHPKLCPEDSTAGDVRRLFADDHVHAILIVSGTRLHTVIDRADLGPQTADSAPATRPGCLTGRVIAPTAPAQAALRQMIAASRRRLAVMGPEGTLLGLLCLKRSFNAFSTLKIIWAGSGYDGAPLARYAKAAAAITVEVVARTAPHSFQVLRRRWVIERTFGWLMRYRRLVRDYERRTDNHEAMIYWATVILMTRRIARYENNQLAARRWGAERKQQDPAPAPA